MTSGLVDLWGSRDPSRAENPVQMPSLQATFCYLPVPSNYEKGTCFVTLTIAFISMITVFLSFPLDLKAYRAGSESLFISKSPDRSMGPDTHCTMRCLGFATRIREGTVRRPGSAPYWSIQQSCLFTECPQCLGLCLGFSKCSTHTC